MHVVLVERLFTATYAARLSCYSLLGTKRENSSLVLASDQFAAIFFTKVAQLANVCLQLLQNDLRGAAFKVLPWSFLVNKHKLHLHSFFFTKPQRVYPLKYFLPHKTLAKPIFKIHPFLLAFFCFTASVGTMLRLLSLPPTVDQRKRGPLVKTSTALVVLENTTGYL